MLLTNIRYALRQIVRYPVFSITAIGTLAVGSGLATAMFIVLNAVLLWPLPYDKPGQLVAMGEANRLDSHPGTSALPRIRAWREYFSSFSGLAYWLQDTKVLENNSQRTSVANVQCSSNLFAVLRSRPLTGRTFDATDESGGRTDVALISARLWRTAFGSGSVNGQSIRLGKDHYAVIGVMPDDFTFPLTAPAAIVWTIAPRKPEWEDANMAMFQVIGRLKDGRSLSAASTEVAAVQSRLGPLAGTVLLEDYRSSLTGHLKLALTAMQAAVVLVWLIGCSNVIGLLIVRNIGRSQEVAIRLAIGAGGKHLFAQYIIESAVLSGCAAILGTFFGHACLRLLRTYLMVRLPFAERIEVTWASVGVIVLLSFISTLAVGIVPALRSFSTSLWNSLQSSDRSMSAGRMRRRLQDGLVVAQVMLSVVLLICSGLLFKTLQNLRRVPLGFNPDRIVSVLLPASPELFKNTFPPVAVDSMIRRLEQAPEVESVSFDTILPMNPNSTADMGVQIAGMAKMRGRASAEIRLVSASYHKALRISLIEGQLFTGEERPNAPWVVIVNRAFARKYSPGESVLRKRLRLNDTGPHMFGTIVGVVSDTQQKSLFEAAAPEVDLPYSQLSPGDDLAMFFNLFGSLAVRTHGTPESAVPTVRRLLGEIDSELSSSRIRTMPEIVQSSILDQILISRLIGIFSLASTLITMCGLYALIAYQVSQSTREIGVRIAFGAESFDILRMIMRRAVVLMGAGILGGLISAAVSTRFLMSFLYSVPATDPLTMIAAAIALLAVGLAVSCAPALRATRIDPVIVLRGA
jgi:predicted permease